jgi:general secretion pathway protein K
MFAIAKIKLKKQRGAALLAVLVVALVMVILMGVASNLLQGRLELAQDSKDALYNKALVYTKRSELMYLLATQRFTVAGISTGQSQLSQIGDEQGGVSFVPIGDEIRTDGFSYKEESGLTYSIQNEAGLIPINSSSQYWLKKWLNSNGYRHSEQMKLADSLADYADPDNVRRPAGAEKGNYVTDDSNDTLNAKNNITNNQPRNFLLQTCSELWQIVNWQTMLKRFPSFIQQCSLRRSGELNLNAVPLSLWADLWPSTVDKIQTDRAKNIWFLSYSNIIAAEPSILPVPEDYYTYIGSRNFLIHVALDNTSIKLHAELGDNTKFPIILKR